MEATYSEIVIGETVCKKLKDLYFNDKEWVDCYNQVAQKFTELKRILRKFYTDKIDVDIFRELIKYSSDDINEVFNMNS